MSEGEIHKLDIDAAFQEGTVIDRALGRAIREALRMHKRLGNPIAVGRNGKVVWIPPDQIPVDD